MKIDFSNQTVLITGATRGIGKQIAEDMHSLNANLILTGTNSEEIKNLNKQDWDDILKRNIQDSDLTVQDLVIEKILEHKAFPK